MTWVTALPTVNATLNATSAMFLVSGYIAIRNRRVTVHRACMVSAFIASSLFLVSYLMYHYHAGSTPFTGRGWVRPVYFAILITHVVLAAAILPLAVVTLSRALRGRFEKHRRIARWTFPIWLYVSVTGIVVYVMLYHLYPAG